MLFQKSYSADIVLNSDTPQIQNIKEQDAIVVIGANTHHSRPIHSTRLRNADIAIPLTPAHTTQENNNAISHDDYDINNRGQF